MEEVSELNNTLKSLPYDFVRENEIIIVNEDGNYKVITPKNISLPLYHEINRYLINPFNIEICSPDEFNELLTSTFSNDSSNSDISEELSDEFDLESFAGSISATEDLLLSLIHI